MAPASSGPAVAGRDHFGLAPLRVLALVPGDPGAPVTELIGPHPVVAHARATAGALQYTVVTDEETAPRCAGLPPGSELIVVPLWRVLPRRRAAAQRPAARLQTGLACLSAVFGACTAGAAPAWEVVHGWGLGGALPAAAAARALGLPWAWTVPPGLPRPDAGAPATDTDEDLADWAAGEADLLVVEDNAHAEALRRLWAPSPERLAVCPSGALAGWDVAPAALPGGGAFAFDSRVPAGTASGGPITGGPITGGPAPGDPPRVGLLCGPGATAREVDAVLAALAELRRDAAPASSSRASTPFPASPASPASTASLASPASPPAPACPAPPAILGLGSRRGEAAAAFRAGARRRGLVPGIGWRDVDAASPLVDPSRVLAGLDLIILLGTEAPPRRLLAGLWRQGTAVVWIDDAPGRGTVAGAVGAAGHPNPLRLAWACCPPERSLLVEAVASRTRDGDARRRACRDAWRAAVDGGEVSPDRLARRLWRAYRNLPGAPGRGAAAGEAFACNQGRR